MNCEVKRHLSIDIEHQFSAPNLAIISPLEVIECGRGDLCDLIGRHSLDGSHNFLQYLSPNRIYLMEWQRQCPFLFQVSNSNILFDLFLICDTQFSAFLQISW